MFFTSFGVSALEDVNNVDSGISESNLFKFFDGFGETLWSNLWKDFNPNSLQIIQVSFEEFLIFFVIKVLQDEAPPLQPTKNTLLFVLSNRLFKKFHADTI